MDDTAMLAPAFFAEFKDADHWLWLFSIHTKTNGCIGYVDDVQTRAEIFSSSVPDLEAGKNATREFVQTLIGAPVTLSWEGTKTFL